MVKIAVIPGAGKGTRLYPATKIIPKIMMPLLNTPVIHLSVMEAIDAGFEKIYLIIGHDGDIVKSYFVNHPGPWTEKIEFILQPVPKGLGDAVLCAKKYIQDQPFAVLFGDSVFLQDNPIYKLLIDFDKYHEPVMAIQPVPDEDTPKRGIFTVSPLELHRYRILEMLEKPPVGTVKHPMAFVARAVFPSSIISILDSVNPDPKGEIQLADAIMKLVKLTPSAGLEIKDHRLDVGNPKDYLFAINEFAKIKLGLS